MRAGFCCTYEGLEGVHFKGLLADLGQIHFELWANVIFLQAFTDLKYFVCYALRSRSWGQRRTAVSNYALTGLLSLKANAFWKDATFQSLICSNLCLGSVNSSHLHLRYYTWCQNLHWGLLDCGWLWGWCHPLPLTCGSHRRLLGWTWCHSDRLQGD